MVLTEFLGIDGVFAGTGTILIGGIECYFYTKEHLAENALRFSRVFGTSGGAAAAAIHGYGLTRGQVYPLLEKVLSGNKLLEINWRPWNGLSVYTGEKLYQTLKEMLPYTMGSSVNHWACYSVDTETGDTIEYSSWGTPGVWAYDAVYRSMCLPFIFKQHAGMVDGGLTVNYAFDRADKWIDGTPSICPTIGFRPSGGKLSGRPKTFAGLVKRIVEIWLKAASDSHVSSKNWAFTCQWETDKSWLDFDFSKEDLLDIRMDAIVACEKFFAREFSPVMDKIFWAAQETEVDQAKDFR